jgi:hypothetical protein
MFKFPLVEPEIAVTDRPEESFEVELMDLGSSFAPRELGAETEFAFYDYPKESAPTTERRLVLTGAHRIRVTRRVRVDDFEMLEIQSHYADVGADYSGPPAFWNSILNETGLSRTVEVQAPGLETWVYRPGDKTPEPRLLRPGLKAEGHEPHHTAREHPDRLTTWRLEVIGAATVSIGPKPYRCLRAHWRAHAVDGDTFAEYFVADTGRTIYFRRFNGPSYHIYGELEGNAEIRHGDVVWRHWYDCLPDHVLVIGQ